MITHHCPACGFGLDQAPWNGDSPSDEICPCCFIHFGYDDIAGGSMDRRERIYRSWRRVWMNADMPWVSVGREPPPDWDPLEQLKRFAPPS